MAKRPSLYCSFCRKSAAQVAKLVGGPGVNICGTCVGLCNDVLAGRPTPPFLGFATLDDAALLAALKPSEAAVDTTRAVLQGHVDILRGRGVSWEKIGAALGVSRQAAWERFG